MSLKANLFFKKALLVLLGLSFIGCSKFEEKINFDLVTFSDAVEFEKEIGAALYKQDDFTPIKGFYPRDTTYSINGRQIFTRSEQDFLPLTIKYYKDSKSDTIRYTIYEWNVATPGTDRKTREQLLFSEIKKFDQYHQKYVQLVKRFKKKYGKPIDGDGVVRKTLTIYPIWKAHMRFANEDQLIDLDWIWIPSNDARVFKIIAKAYPKN